jgi:putative FmdB family regulatory protein
MPIYEYECTDCGGFAASRPMALYKEPADCPGCGQASPRALLSAPAFSAMPGNVRKAHAINEKSAHAPRESRNSEPHKHSASCGCGSKSIGASKTVKAPDGSKAFPSKRPWMISH